MHPDTPSTAHRETYQENLERLIREVRFLAYCLDDVGPYDPGTDPNGYGQTYLERAEDALRIVRDTYIPHDKIMPAYPE